MKQIFLSVWIFNLATVFPVHKTAFNEQYFLWSRLWSLRSRNLIDDNASVFYGHFDAVPPLSTAASVIHTICQAQRAIQ